MKEPPRFYMVVDLEATCCDQETIPRKEMEIIEIGAVMVDSLNFIPISEFQTFVHPVQHPQLTEFCVALTSITQTDVDQAPLFPEAIAHFKTWMEHYPNLLFGSWGKFDRYQIKQDCRLHGIPYPIAEGYINLKTRFAKSQKLKRRPSMVDALDLAGLTLQGYQHRGIDDARNIARLLPYIVGGKQISSCVESVK